jgi:protein gp37
VFVNSMSDLFHKDVTDDFQRGVFYTMAITQRHTYQVLTKRPKRMRNFAAGVLDWTPTPDRQRAAAERVARHVDRVRRLRRARRPLRETPAAVRFISAEPLLGPLPSLDLTGIDWLIVGGESGPNARPIEAEWVRDLQDHCQSTGTAFFFKQWGGRTPEVGGRELDGRTWDEMPERQKTKQIATAIANDLRRISDSNPLKGQFLAMYANHVWLKDYVSGEGRVSLDNPSPEPIHPVDGHSTVLGTGGGNGVGVKGWGSGKGNKSAAAKPYSPDPEAIALRDAHFPDEAVQAVESCAITLRFRRQDVTPEAIRALLYGESGEGLRSTGEAA